MLCVKSGQTEKNTVFMPVLPEVYWVDPRSRLVQEGQLTFDAEGAVHRSCVAVVQGWVLLAPNGTIRDASSALQRHEVLFVDAAEALRRWQRACALPEETDTEPLLEGERDAA